MLMKLLPTAIANRLSAPIIPEHIQRNFRRLEPTRQTTFLDTLKSVRFPQATFDTAAEQASLASQLTGRLEIDRRLNIPWLDDAKALDGANILEIGCGTGSSTVALAEQGAKVIALDVAEDTLVVARARTAAYGLDARFEHMNAVDASRRLADCDFDAIIFWACLEHMTHKERMQGMKATWEMLRPGALWCVTDTPNRLWYFDQHTSLLPFYDWLPHDLAIEYARLSPQPEVNERFCDYSGDEETMLDFLRLGRGLSYHEFDLTMGAAEDLDVVSSLPLFLRRQRIAHRLKWALSADSKFERFLKRMRPDIDAGFFQQDISLIVRKP